ncbi:trace amine-associated receptor 13c-like [Oculina patagonica]
MANLSGTNSSKEFRNITMDGEEQNVPLDINIIITVIFNCITCPFTVLLNVLVIMAVKRRPRLQTYTNILLACLAVTDTLTGLLVQPTFILYHIDRHMFKPYHFPHNSILLFFTVSSAVHLVIVTCERLIAIKFTMHYPYLVTNRTIKKAVITCWVVALICTIVRTLKPSRKLGDAIVALVLILCIVFIAVCYVILYLETLRHRKQIKTQQLPQEEVERFAKESKALKTTVYVVGAVMLCFLPMATAFVMYATGLKIAFSSPWIRTCVMLNSLLNPLIYCWRQKEMRQFVFRIKPSAVAAIN